jgi:hypothetical protein
MAADRADYSLPNGVISRRFWATPCPKSGGWRIFTLVTRREIPMIVPAIGIKPVSRP